MTKTDEINLEETKSETTVTFKIKDDRTDIIKEWLIDIVHYNSPLKNIYDSYDTNNSVGITSIIKAQRVILNSAYKFPRIQDLPPNHYNAIVIDMRGFYADKSDFGAYKNILYGSHNLPEAYQRWWKDKNNQRNLIVGILDSKYRDFDSRAIDLQEKVHAICFMHEKTFAEGEMNSKDATILYANPESDTTHMREIWPLYPLITEES